MLEYYASFPALMPCRESNVKCNSPNSFHQRWQQLYKPLRRSLKQNAGKFPKQSLLAASAFEARCDAGIFKAGFVQSKAAYYTVCPNKSGSLLPFLEQQQSQAFMCHQSPPNRQKHKEAKEGRGAKPQPHLEFRIETAR